MTEKKMGTGEVAGHLRAASRIFKAFEFAEEMAVLVLTAESSVKKLEKEVKSLQKEKEILNKECDNLVSKSNKAEADLKANEEAVEDASKYASKKASELLTAKREEAKAIVDRAENEAKIIRSKTTAAKAKQAEAEANQIKAETELGAIASKVSQAKESFMKAFG